MMISHLLSSLSVSSSTLLSPQNMKLSHPSPSRHAMIISEHWVQHTPSTACTEYCNIQKSTLYRSQLVWNLSSLGGPCCTQFSTFTQLWVNHWIECQLPSRLLLDLLPPDRPPPSTPPIWIDHGLQVDLQTRLITASKRFSYFTWSQRPSASLISLDHTLHVRMITSS